MKTLAAPTIRNMAEAIASKTMLAAMAALCIRFINRYMAASTWLQILLAVPTLTCTYARKRIVNQITHHRKFALFQRSCGQGRLT
jgi:hypothetical protein